MRIKLSEIVSQFLDGADYGDAEYSKAYRIAIRGWRNLNWDVTGDLVRDKVPVECDMTVCIPEGCISIKKVGIVGKGGNLITLKENPNLTDFTCYTDLEDEPSNTVSDSWWDSEVNWAALNWSGSLGVGSYRAVGEFRIDTAKNRLILNPEFNKSHVILEYLAHPKIEGEYTIHEFASEALLSYLRWQWFINKKGTAQGEREQYRREFFNDKRLAQLRIKKPLNQVLRQVTKEQTMAAVRS
jgi:hypothetical protein